jgi:hypothetical protein
MALMVLLGLAAGAVLGAEDALPRPGLFDVGWSDVTPFLAGLVAAEQTPSAGLLESGATVYHVSLTIDASLSVVETQMEIAYTNREDDPLDALLFRVFPLLVDGSLDGLSAAVGAQTASTTLDAAAGTLSISLHETLQPGERIAVRLDATIRVPTAPAGHYGILESGVGSASFAHVLPLVAAYDAGRWQTEVPPSYGDVTYADASFFLVHVTAPAEVTLVTSGIQIARAAGVQTQACSFAAGPAREFYLAADADLARTSATLGEITVNSYAPVPLQRGATIALQRALDAIAVYESLLGRYPYTEFDVVASPIRAGGMEFPGIVLIAEGEYGRAQPPNGRPGGFFELAIAHEVGHQWFYNLVGNDQIAEPWLDESMTQYVTWRYFEALYGAAGNDYFSGWVRSRTFGLPTPAPAIGWPVAAYSEALYGATIYARGPQFVKALEDELGRDALDAFFRDYVASLRWEIASTETFRDQLEASCGCDLAALFAEWVYGN